MNGVLLLNKEKGMTSHAAIQKVKKILGVKKIGHAGTLDPLATGLLVVLVNSATKLSNYLLNQDKEYFGEVTIGIGTDSEDAEGKIISQTEVEKLDDSDRALAELVGRRFQVPPLYSALKMDGMKLYEYARAGRDVERKPREVVIHRLERKSPVTYVGGAAKFSFYCKVSKGTYVRTLAKEIGEKLGYPAHLSALERLASGPFRIEEAHTLQDLESGNYRLIKMADSLAFPKIEAGILAERIKNGNKLPENLVGRKDPHIAFTENGELLAIYKYIKGTYHAERVWN